ncbi:MAG: hypothetical protein HDT18_08725 [Oscillibacter sp.]|nr:hypothetical protein [Oscillibacter sp.]
MKRGGGVSGAVSLVMIFCVLCLAVFAVLTLATADRERNLAELTARSAADYYTADCRAVEIVAALRDGDTVPADVEIRHTGSEYPGGQVEEAEFSVPINDGLALDVAVRLRGGNCEILRWQTVYTGEWEIDESMDIWDGT